MTLRREISTATAAGALQIGERVTWLAGWDYGEPSEIVKFRELDDFPEDVPTGRSDVGGPGSFTHRLG